MHWAAKWLPQAQQEATLSFEHRGTRPFGPPEIKFNVYTPLWLPQLVAANLDPTKGTLKESYKQKGEQNETQLGPEGSLPQKVCP